MLQEHPRLRQHVGREGPAGVDAQTRLVERFLRGFLPVSEVVLALGCDGEVEIGATEGGDFLVRGEAYVREDDGDVEVCEGGGRFEGERGGVVADCCLTVRAGRSSLSA